MNFFRQYSQQFPPQYSQQFPPQPDPYAALEVVPTSSDDDIKKAFRRLSLKYHPDKNPGNPDAIAKFHAISDAYTLLSDKQRKREYDFRQYRNQTYAASGGVPPTLQEMIMQEIFGGAMPPSGGGNGVFMGVNPLRSSGPSQPNMVQEMPQDEIGELLGAFFSGHLQQHRNHMATPQPQPKPEPIAMDLDITMDDVVQGAQIPLQIERWVYNPATRIRQQERETHYVDIMSGIDDGEIITIPDKGHVNGVGPSAIGDVKVTIRVQNNTEFRRKGLDLLYGKHITLRQALCGDFEFELRLIGGGANGDATSATIKNKRGGMIEPNYRKVYPGMGIKRNGQTGNLIIHFIVDFPQRLTEEQMTKLEEILG